MTPKPLTQQPNLTGRIFRQDDLAFLVTDRAPRRSGCAVVRLLSHPFKLMDIPLTELYGQAG
ncbi:MAG: hypothetical protein AAF529_24460 [Pseudomonadota bacterium]